MSWVVGLIASLAAGIAGAVGKLLLKKRHMIDQASGPGSKNALVALALGTLGLIINPVLDVFSYGLMSQTMKAPLAGMVVIWNVVFAPLIVKEIPTKVDILASAMVFIGTVCFGFGGPKETPEYTYRQLFDLFTRRPFVIFAVVHGGWVLTLAVCINLPRVTTIVKQAAFGLAAGSVGGLFFFTKCFATFIIEPEARGAFTHWQGYPISLGAATTALGGLLIMNAGLKKYSALLIAPMYQGTMVIVGSLSGIAFFDEAHNMSQARILLYFVGVGIILGGIVVLCVFKRPALDSEACKNSEEPGTEAGKGTEASKGTEAGQGTEAGKGTEDPVQVPCDDSRRPSIVSAAGTVKSSDEDSSEEELEVRIDCSMKTRVLECPSGTGSNEPPPGVVLTHVVSDPAPPQFDLFCVVNSLQTNSSSVQ
jgi:hypothetical protein